LRSPSGAADIPFTAEGATGSGVFIAGIAMPQRAETGTGSSVPFVDTADLTRVRESTVPQGDASRRLRGRRQRRDPRAPDRAEIGRNQRIEVTVEDDRSGGVGHGRSELRSRRSFPSRAGRTGRRHRESDAGPANADAGSGRSGISASPTTRTTPPSSRARLRRSAARASSSQAAGLVTPSLRSSTRCRSLRRMFRIRSRRRSS
jgi:hypothetical protein